MKAFPRHIFSTGIWTLAVAIAVTVMTISFPSTEMAVASPSADTALLLEKYRVIRDKIKNSAFGMPIFLESEEKGDSLRGDVYGILPYPFASLVDNLQSPAAWCKITTLHLNVKGCTFQKEGDGFQLTLYSGSKHYQSPEKAHRLDFSFHVAAKTERHLNIAISAEKGPYFAKECLIGLEAMPLNPSSTLMHFSYSYQYGLLVRMLIKTYLATAGHDKVGFSMASTSGEGNPRYIKGVRGAMERNAVRYYLALMAYLDTSNLPEAQQFDKRVRVWFSLTERYPRQLHEIDRREYLENKAREHNDGLKLQAGSDIT